MIEKKGQDIKKPHTKTAGTSLELVRSCSQLLKETATMTEADFLVQVKKIKPPNETKRQEALKRLDSLVKPPGSLGTLEEIAVKMAAITGKVFNYPKRAGIIVMAGDNGVFEEGISSAPQSVTASQTINIIKGLTGMGTISAYFGNERLVIDLGVNGDISHPLLVSAKTGYSTNNICKGPAMTRKEGVSCLLKGMAAAKAAKAQGWDMIGVGEMGIGNTTTGSAVLSGILGLKGQEALKTVGKGGGLTHEAFEKKKAVVIEALERNRPNSRDPIDVLCKVGGFDIAGMTGVFLGAAAEGLPVVMDGFISGVAALCAVKIEPQAADYLFTSHHSFEKGFQYIMDELAMSAPLHLNLRLGEGSGCPLMFSIIACACDMMANMATFAEADIDDEYLEPIKAGKNSF